MFAVIHSFRLYKLITDYANYDVIRGQKVTCKSVKWKSANFELRKLPQHHSSCTFCIFKLFCHSACCSTKKPINYLFAARAKLHVARYCQGKLSVCLSVRLWRWGIVIIYVRILQKMISRLISLTISLSQTPTWRIYSKGNTPNFSRNRSWVGKIVDFRHLSHHIFETVQDRVQIAIGH